MTMGHRNTERTHTFHSCWHCQKDNQNTENKHDTGEPRDDLEIPMSLRGTAPFPQTVTHRKLCEDGVQ